jgi:DNA end-binding protein Ku
LDAALHLVEARATHFEPHRYHDVHRERLLAFIERRAQRTRPKGAERRPVVHAGATAGPPSQNDLLAALERSVAALRAGQPLPPETGSLRVRPQAAAREVRERSRSETSGSSTPEPGRKKDEGGEPSA